MAKIYPYEITIQLVIQILNMFKLDAHFFWFIMTISLSILSLQFLHVVTTTFFRFYIFWRKSFIFIYCLPLVTMKGSKDLLIQKRFVCMTFFFNIKCIANCAKNEINHFVAWYELSNIEKVSCAFLEYKVVFPLGQYKSGTSYSKHVHDHTFFS